MLKRCSRCCLEFPEEDFDLDNRTKDGRSLACTKCSEPRSRFGIVVNGKKFCPKCGRWRETEAFAKNRAASSGLQSWCRKCNGDAERQRALGVTSEQYEALKELAGGVCEICKQPSGRRDLDVDHDHQTGLVRGLLCEPCNKGLGHFRDRPDLLEMAAAYLRSRKAGDEHLAGAAIS